MNKKMLGIIVVLSLPLSVFAQADKGADFKKRHGNKVEMMAKNLGLTDAEKVKVTEIYKEQHIKHKAIKQETRKRLSEILTADQMKQYDEMKKHGKAMRKEKMQGKMKK